MEYRTASIMVTYFPDQTVMQNLIAIARASDLLVIIDNTEIQNPADHFQNLPELNIILVHNKKNIGLAAALNKGILIAGERGFENIFLFDQDTAVPGNFFSEMIAFKSQVEKEHPDRCALYVPNFFDRNSETYAKFPVISRCFFRHIDCRGRQSYFVGNGIIAITSGSLIPFSKYREIGPFMSDYFIDFIDNEYCLRIASMGFLVALNCKTTINHAIGFRRSKKLLGITIKPNSHPGIRRYYIARNGIRTAVIYSGFTISYIVLVALRLMHEFLSIILYERYKHDKFKCIIRGIVDGVRARMGGRG